MHNFIRSITHGVSPSETFDFHVTTRWFRFGVRYFHYYFKVKNRVLDWWKGETYIPLFFAIVGETHPVRFSEIKAVLRVGNGAVPESVGTIEDLPHFRTPGACRAHISETWPHLEDNDHDK